MKTENLACSRLSVSEDDRKRERATSGISGERDPGKKRRPLIFPYQTPLVACPLFQSSPLTESLEQAIFNYAFQSRKARGSCWKPVGPHRNSVQNANGCYEIHVVIDILYWPKMIVSNCRSRSLGLFLFLKTKPSIIRQRPC